VQSIDTVGASGAPSLQLSKASLHITLSSRLSRTITNVFVINYLIIPAEMPSSDYSSAIGGGLKLKGAKDAGIKKKKKSKPAEPTSSTVEAQSSDDTVLQKAIADEETNLEASGVEREAESKQYGKTEAQKRHDERRRKRVCLSGLSRNVASTSMCIRLTEV